MPSRFGMVISLQESAGKPPPLEKCPKLNRLSLKQLRMSSFAEIWYRVLHYMGLLVKAEKD